MSSKSVTSQKSPCILLTIGLWNNTQLYETYEDLKYINILTTVEGGKKKESEASPKPILQPPQ